MAYNPFKFYYLLLNCLQEINRLKSIIIRLSKYEFASKLRDIEKQLLDVESKISDLNLPLPSPASLTLTVQKQSELFKYAQALRWTDLPDYISSGLIERKKNLNDNYAIDVNQQTHYQKINQLLKQIEGNLEIILTSFAVPTDCDEYFQKHVGFLKLEFFTGELTANEFLYQFSYPTDDYLFQLSEYDAIGVRDSLPEDDMLCQLPLIILDDGLSFLFFLIMKNGYISWRDLLKVKEIRVKLPVYHLTRCKPI